MSSAAAVKTLPYERIDSAALAVAVRLKDGERLLVLQPFGWHIDGAHIPNAAEQFDRAHVCQEHGWRVVADFGPYIAIVRGETDAEREHRELLDALNGLIAFIEVLSGRSDLPDEIRRAMKTSPRFSEAVAVAYKAIQTRGEQ